MAFFCVKFDVCANTCRSLINEPSLAHSTKASVKMLISPHTGVKNSCETRFFGHHLDPDTRHGKLLAVSLHSCTAYDMETTCATRAQLVCSVAEGSLCTVFDMLNFSSSFQSSPTEAHTTTTLSHPAAFLQQFYHACGKGFRA